MTYSIRERGGGILVFFNPHFFYSLKLFYHVYVFCNKYPMTYRLLERHKDIKKEVKEAQRQRNKILLKMLLLLSKYFSLTLWPASLLIIKDNGFQQW